ncbi:unnamed protein product, partial [Durusdinium trenchii]
GTVSAREWVQDLSICLQGTDEQRKDLVFRMFADETGVIPAQAATELMATAQAAASIFTQPVQSRRALRRETSWASDAEALGHAVRIDLKMPPLHASDERVIIEKINDKFSPDSPGNVGDVWYLIPARWWKQWLEFTSTETNSREQGPPSIDNTGLVDA